MLATARGLLVDASPHFARVVGGYYPNLPTRLWEYRLHRNREALVVWRAGTGEVRCERVESGWQVSVSSPVLTTTADEPSFNEALGTAYGYLSVTSEETDLEPLPPFDASQTERSE
jgi:hypothetical protein